MTAGERTTSHVEGQYTHEMFTQCAKADPRSEIRRCGSRDSFPRSTHTPSLHMPSTRNHSETSSANFEALLNEALTKYTEKTGKNLRDHPLASNIDRCNSAESFLAIFQQQAQDFDEFRNGDSKLIEWLRPVVDGLLFLSNSGVVDTVADIVSPHKVALLCSMSDVVSV